MNATIVNELADVVRELLVTERKAHAAEVDGLRAELSDLREQIKAIPAPVMSTMTVEGFPGPAGERGEKGDRGESGPPGDPARDGRDGRDGKDGIASRDEVRAEAAKAVEELRAELLVEVKKAAAEEIAALPTMQHKGVWKEGEYRAGDCVSWAGSTWHAVSKTAEKPGDGATAWVLIAKRGNPGKDAR